MLRLFEQSGSPAKRSLSSQEEVPVLCRLWRGGGEWNASAIDIPVAVSGDRIEDVQQHLLEAIVSRLMAFRQTGGLEPEIKRLQQIAHKCRIGVEEMSDCELLWRGTAKISCSDDQAPVINSHVIGQRD